MRVTKFFWRAAVYTAAPFVLLAVASELVRWHVLDYARR